MIDEDIRKVKSFWFKLLNQKNPQNVWVAFGACYKNIIQQKNFSFKNNELGHGAYMITSNGATWSNHQK